MRNNMDHLFCKYDLGAAIRGQKDRAQEKVDAISQDQFLSSDDAALVEHVYSELQILPVELYDDQKEMDSAETKVDVSHDSMRAIRSRSGPCYVPGLKITVSIPYSGDPELWRCQPSSFTSAPPIGAIRQPNSEGIGYLDIVFERPSDALDQARLKADLDREINEIKKYLGWINRDVEQGNQALRGHIKQHIDNRRKRLEKHLIVAESFNIPLKRRPGAPDMQKLPIRRKLVRPLPPAPKSRPEPVIADEEFEHIINIIRHEGLSWETTPRTFAKHDEEELRDIILGHLNTHYQGGATGETFRKSGKTDIRIEDQNRAAFVGECKVWRGPKELMNALDQLLGYLTWRDCKAALVIFNKNVAGFSDIRDKVPATLQSHGNFIRALDPKQAGEWRFFFSSADDPGLKVTVHIFLFNLFVNQSKE